MAKENPRRRTAGMTPEQMEAAVRARLRRDYRELSPAQRIEQVAELSRQFAQPTIAGRDV